MVRKRVIVIFTGLMIFTLAVFLIQLNTEQGFTGSIISDVNSALTEKEDNAGDFSLKIESYRIKSNVLDVSYSISDTSGKDHKLEVTYFIHDEAAKVFKSGKEDVLLEKGKDMDYTLSFSFTSEEADSLYLTILADDGYSVERDRVPLSFSSSSITGGTIRDMKVNAVNYFLVMLISLVVLFYIIKAIYSHRLVKKMSKNRNDRFIPVHH